jgi:hypothetical protein
MRKLPANGPIIDFPVVEKEKAFKGKKDKLWPGYIDLP